MYFFKRKYILFDFDGKNGIHFDRFYPTLRQLRNNTCNEMQNTLLFYRIIMPLLSQTHTILNVKGQ